MTAIVHSIYSQSVHALALNAGSMDNDAERYCKIQLAIIIKYSLIKQNPDLDICSNIASNVTMCLCFKLIHFIWSSAQIIALLRKITITFNKKQLIYEVSVISINNNRAFNRNIFVLFIISLPWNLYSLAL